MGAIGSPQTLEGKRIHGVLSSDQVHERVNSFAEMKFEEAETAYRNYRSGLLQHLKSAESAVDKATIQSYLDECESRFACIYDSYRSGKIKEAFWAIEWARNEVRRERAKRAAYPAIPAQDNPSQQVVKQVRKAKVQKTSGEPKKRIAALKAPEVNQDSIGADGIREKLRRKLARQGFQAVAVKNDRAVCIACGECVALTDDRKRWAPHRGKPWGICNPDMGRVKFVFIGGGMGHLRESSSGDISQQAKKTKKVATSKKDRSTTAPKTAAKSVAPKKRIRSVLVSENLAKCPDCGRVVEFISRRRTLITHMRKGSRSLCHPDYSNILFVNKKDKQGGMPNSRVSGWKESRSGLATAEKRAARQGQKKMDRLIMRDPSYGFGLQDHDVEDSGWSVEAYHGGLPHSSRRFH